MKYKFTSDSIIQMIAIVACLSAGAYAVNRCWALKQTQAMLMAREQNILDAQSLIERHTEAFVAQRQISAKNELKALAQESSARHDARLMFLSESEKDLGDNIKERNVVCRAANIEQAKLAQFLCDIEKRGDGARVKELVFGIEGCAQNAPALCDLLTTFGSGKINLNTAPASVLYALDEEFDEALIHRVILQRECGVNAPFRVIYDLEQVEGIVQMEIVDGAPKIIKNLLLKILNQVAVESVCFSARITARINDHQRQAWAFLQTPPPREELSVASVKLIAFEEIEQ